MIGARQSREAVGHASMAGVGAHGRGRTPVTAQAELVDRPTPFLPALLKPGQDSDPLAEFAVTSTVGLAAGDH